MAVRIHTEVDMTGVEKKFHRSNTDRGQFAMGNQMLADMTRYVPRFDGDLQSSGHLSPDMESLIWDTPYAKSQWQGGNTRATFRNYTTPGTGPYWDQIAKGNHMKSWEQAWVKGAGF